MKAKIVALMLIGASWCAEALALDVQNVSGPANVATWGTNAATWRGKNGQAFAYQCPASGTAASVWGTDLYTDDSSICTAAVHAGLITFATGGTVVIEIRPGQPSYTGSNRNNVLTAGYGAWTGSFAFVSARSSPAAQPPASDAQAINWNFTPKELRGEPGQTFSYSCAANGEPARVWGTDIYTDDSSICTAAVHAGRIDPARGGVVTFEIRPGQPSFIGTGRRGILTESYGAWGRSFVFLDNPPER